MTVIRTVHVLKKIVMANFMSKVLSNYEDGVSCNLKWITAANCKYELKSYFKKLEIASILHYKRFFIQLPTKMYL